MPRNTDVLGILAILFIISNRGQARPLDIASIIYQLHRISRFVNKLDNLGQLALNSPSLPNYDDYSHEDEGSGLDFSSLMKNIGPIMSAFSSNYNEDENRNAIF